MKVDQYSVNMGSTKYHGRESFNIRRLPEGSNTNLSAMKYVATNECKYFAIGACVNLFGLNNLEFNGKVGVIKSSLEPSGRQDVPLHSHTHVIVLPL